MANGLWFWFTAADADGSFSSASDALESAWNDAVGITMGMNHLASEQWEALSFDQQKIEITDALTQGNAAMATA